MSISLATGFPATIAGTNQKTLAVTPHAVDDIMLVTIAGTDTTAVTAVSGGGVTTWNKITDGTFSSTNATYYAVWWGKVTSTGSSTITLTYTDASNYVEISAFEFSGSSTWSVESWNVNVQTSTTTLTAPSLTPATTGAMYFGFFVISHTPTAGTTTGFTWYECYDSNYVAYDLAPSQGTAYQPSMTQSTAGGVVSFGAIIATVAGGASSGLFFPFFSSPTLADTTDSPDWVGAPTSLGETPSTTLFPVQTVTTPTHVTAVEDPLGEYGLVWQFQVTDTDRLDIDDQPREDIASPTLFADGDTLFYWLGFLIPDDLPLIDNTDDSFAMNFMYAEVYINTGPGGPPPFMHAINAFHETGVNHYAVVLNSAGSNAIPWMGPALDGQWHEQTIEVCMSSDASTGYIKLWFDGTQQSFWGTGSYNPNSYAATDQLFFSTIQSVNPAPNFLNINQYRTHMTGNSYAGDNYTQTALGTPEGTVTTWHRAPIIGPTYASVQP